MEHVAGAVGDFAAGQHGDRPADVLGQAPAIFHEQAARDHAVVFLGDRGAHVGADQAGANFVDRDAELGQPVGP